MSGVQSVMLGIGGAPGVINGSLPDGSAVDTQALFQLNADGTYTISTSQTGNWIDPASAVNAAYYQVKVDVLSGSFASGTTGTWLDMTEDRAWSINIIGTPGDANPNTNAVSFSVSIREKATGVVRSTQTRGLSATDT